MLKTKIQPNKKQQECIDNTEGKYLVLAGPGTGKTFSVIQRIKNIINKGTEPNKILCLTFTDAACNEMKKRLESELNTLSVDVDIFTYHGFCVSIIDENSEEFELPNNYKVITESVTRAFIKECIEEINPKAYRTEKNDPYYYIDTIKDGIEEIKKNRLTKEKYFENLENNLDWKPGLVLLENKLIEKNKKNDTRTKTLIENIDATKKKIQKAKELWQFFELYSKKMEHKHYLDFNDMINFVLDKFEKNPAFLEKIANKYEYLFVDEYQDTNKSQNSIVFHLTHAIKSENVFVVGDDDQIIYAFQGAKLDTMEKFLEEFPDTKVICLKENMRSTQKILDASRKIVLQDTRRLEINPKFSKYEISKELISKNENLKNKNTDVRLYKYADKMQEYNEIVDEIEEIINSSNCPLDKEGNKNLSEIAILAKSNAELEEFSQMLKARNIPYELKEGKNVFKIPAVNVLYFYLQLLTNEALYSRRIFQILLSKPFSINPKDYLKIYDNISKEKTFIEVLEKMPKEEFIESEKITKFLETFNYLKQYKTSENIRNTILETGSKTGIFDYYLNSEINKTENIAGLKKFIDEASTYSEIYKTSLLEDFIEYLEIITEDDIEILTDKAPVSLNAVQLCTYYSAKGREFEYVYMPTLIRDKWESDNHSMKAAIPLDISEYKDEKELKELKYSDRIKVMYVGMTRAKHTLRLSYPETIDKKTKKPSVFIENIQDICKREDELFELTEQSFWLQASKALIKRDYDYKSDFCNLVDAKIKDKSFSPSSINTYMKCPRQYLYTKILGLSGKDGSPNFFSFGTAIHTALEFFVKTSIDTSNYPSKEDFIESFENSIKNLPLSDFEQRKILEKRGEDALEKYYQRLINTSIASFYSTETPVNFELDGFKFYGIIDRIDKNKDGTYTIYDYKTGNAKDKNDISVDGDHFDYYNQMGLYKYFFEASTGLKVKETTFIFPEDFTNNLTVEYTNEDCSEIIDKFKASINNIKNYNFEPTFNNKACKYCPCRDFCAAEVL